MASFSTVHRGPGKRTPARRVSATASLGLALLVCSLGPAGAANHPHDMLDEAEIAEAIEILKANDLLPSGSLLISLDLEPPEKAAVLAWRKEPSPATLPPRRARAVFRHASSSSVAVVDLSAGKLASRETVSPGQVAIVLPELFSAIQAIFADERMRRALEKRGIEKIGLDTLYCAPRTVGNFGEEVENTRRLTKIDCFDLRDNPTNIFATPVENLYAVVDLDSGEVLDVRDLGLVPVPRGTHSLAKADQERLRERSELPETTGSFTLDGWVVRWENWQAHISWSTHAGLVLSDVSYRDQGEARSVLYEGHLSELYVPYMDPNEGWYFRNYFDEGDYGLGTTSAPLVKGSDCPAGARYLTPIMANASGGATRLEDRICIFERATGEPTWRHFDMLSGQLDSRADRDLIVRSIATVGNYDYLFDWILDAKGRITFRGGASGLDAVKAVRATHLDDESAEEDTGWGPLIAPNRAGINHDHFFSLRLDLDIDGTTNRFVKDELYVEEQPEGSKRKSLWRVRERVLENESEARLEISLREPSLWRVQSSERKNAMGYPTSYQLRSGGNALPLVDREDSPLERAAFANHHLWITRHSADERWAAGEFPNQLPPGSDAAGLPAWTEGNRAIANQDIVLWYTLGFHHVPSSEDWPVYNVGWHSVTLAPYNFFDRNPAMDLP